MGANRDALEEQVEALATGREHRALVEVCRGLADRVDAEEGFDDALWREYRLNLKALREAVSGGGDDTFDLVAELRAEVRDSEDAGS